MLSITSLARAFAALTISVGAASAQEIGPGQTRVIITPKATVTSTSHYQAIAGIACTGSSCFVVFPAPGAKKRLNLTRVYCVLQSNSMTSKYNYGRVELLNSSNSLILFQNINNVFSSASGTHTLNDPIDLQVAPSEHIGVSLNLTSATADFAYCTVSGTLSTLG